MNVNSQIINESNVTVNGNGNIVNGAKCTVNGNNNIVNGARCIVNGRNNIVNGVGCVENGRNNIINGAMKSTRGNKTISVTGGVGCYTGGSVMITNNPLFGSSNFHMKDGTVVDLKGDKFYIDGKFHKKFNGGSILCSGNKLTCDGKVVYEC